MLIIYKAGMELNLNIPCRVYIYVVCIVRMYLMIKYTKRVYMKNILLQYFSWLGITGNRPTIVIITTSGDNYYRLGFTIE